MTPAAAVSSRRRLHVSMPVHDVYAVSILLLLVVVLLLLYLLLLVSVVSAIRKIHTT